jgi:signal transduction histidine kinase
MLSDGRYMLKETGYFIKVKGGKVTNISDDAEDFMFIVLFAIVFVMVIIALALLFSCTAST